MEIDEHRFGIDDRQITGGSSEPRLSPCALLLRRRAI